MEDLVESLVTPKQFSLCKYTGRKISKVKWLPSEITAPSLVFIAGTCGERENNTLSLWTLREPNSDIDNVSLLAETIHPGGVTDIKLYTNQTGDLQILTTSSTGKLTLFALQQPENSLVLTQIISFPVYSSPATCVTRHEPTYNIATCGEDGQIDIFSGSINPLITLPNPDPSSVISLHYLSDQILVSISSSYKVKLWDLRSSTTPQLHKTLVPSNRPNSDKSAISYDPAMLHSAAFHPHQKYVATGASDGYVAIWDLDFHHNSEIIQLNFTEQKHKDNVWDLQFHPSAPDCLLSGGQDGCVFLKEKVFLEKVVVKDRPKLKWQNLGPRGGEQIARQVVSHYLPILSFDVHAESNVVVCAGEGSSLLFQTLPNIF